MVYGLLATVTSAARIQPVDPFGRIGSSTCSHAPWSCSTRNTRGAPFSLGLSSVVVGSPSTGSAKTSTCAPGRLGDHRTGGGRGRRVVVVVVSGTSTIGAIASGRPGVVARPASSATRERQRARDDERGHIILPAATGAT